MKHVSWLGLAAATAALLTAVAGVGAASATQICRPASVGEADGKCLSAAFERELSTNESFSATTIGATFTSSLTNVSCTHSAITLKMTSANTIFSISGEVTALSFSGCKTSSGTACTASVANLPYAFSLNSSELAISDGTGVSTKLVCGFVVNCTLSAKEMLWGVSGSALIASNEKMTTSGGACPESWFLDANYSTQVTISL